MTARELPIGVRWRIPVILAVTVFVNYLDRNNLALALPRIAQEFGWSDREVGSKGELLLGAFFLSYALSNMLLSPLAERFGAKHSPGCGVSDVELAYISTGRGTSDVATVRTPRASYVRDRRFWLAVAGGTLNAFCAFGIINWLPTYFNRAKGIDFERLGWPLALVFATGIAGIILMAYLGDRLGRRTLLASVGFLVAGVMVYIASIVNNLGLLVLFFAIAVFFQSAYAAQEYAIVQHLLPAEKVGTDNPLLTTSFLQRKLIRVNSSLECIRKLRRLMNGDNT